jgi:hypothetical protein
MIHLSEINTRDDEDIGVAEVVCLIHYVLKQ